MWLQLTYLASLCTWHLLDLSSFPQAFSIASLALFGCPPCFCFQCSVFMSPPSDFTSHCWVFMYLTITHVIHRIEKTTFRCIDCIVFFRPSWQADTQKLHPPTYLWSLTHTHANPLTWAPLSHPASFASVSLHSGKLRKWMFSISLAPGQRRCRVLAAKVKSEARF